MTRQIVVDVIGDSKGLNKTLDDATTRTSKFGSVAKGVGMGIGFGLFGIVTEGIGMMVGKLGEADQAFKEDAANQAKLGEALKANIPAWDGNIAAIEKRVEAGMDLAFSDDAIRDSLATLSTSITNVDDMFAAQAAAMDLARLKGIDLATATDIIQKANMGQMRGLKSVGIELDKNASLQEILAAVQAKAGTQAEAYAAGPLAAQERAQIKVGEAMEKLGSAVNQVSSVLLPIAAEAFTVLIDIIGEVWAVIGPLVDILMKELGPVLKQVAAFVTGTVAPALRMLFQTILPPLKVGVQQAASVFRVAFGIISAVVGAAVKAISVAVGVANKVIGTIGTAVTTVANTIRGVINGVVSFFGGIGGRIASATRGMWNGILTAFKSVVNTIIRGWNSISFSVPSVDLGPLGKVGGFTLGTPNIPYLHQGGTVPGPRGADVLSILQAGETVVPMNGRGGGQTVVINIESFIGTDQDLDRLADRVALRIRTA